MSKASPKTAQDIQDDILRKMSAKRKIQLTWELSSFLLKLGQKNDRNRIAVKKNCQDPGKIKN